MKTKTILPTVILRSSVILLSAAVLLLQGCKTDTETETQNKDSNSFLTSLETVSDMDTIYTLEYQSDIAAQIENLKNSKNYTLEDPLVIANPYGTNTTGLYISFSTDSPTKSSYTVSADDYEDFSGNLNENYTTEHEYLLVGIVPDTENTISLTVTDKNGKEAGSLELIYDAPSLLGSEKNIQLDIMKGNSSAQLSDGLYTMLGNRTEEDNDQVDFLLLYDNSGTIRSEIPIQSYRACNVLFDNEEMYFSTSAETIAAMNSLGQITDLYDMGNYTLHHDYIWGSHDDILVLATEKDSATEEDRILSVDRDNGEVAELIDLSDLFENYFDTLDMTDSEEAFDWMHINSLQLVGEDSIIISSRETSSIIRIDHIYEEPSVNYIISSSQFWEESGYDDLVLEQDGDFSLNAGQHCVVYEPSEDLEDGQYYLSFYNNNNAVISTRDYDYSSDSGYDGTFSGVEGDTSYYDRYLVDESERTFTLEERIPVTYSGYVSSVQNLGNNLLVDSGSAFAAVEFDVNGEPIQTLTGTGDTWWYRVFKYDYKGFWFE